MTGLRQTVQFLCMPLQRARGLQKDEGGQAMLLSGMMVFLITIMAVVTLDTSQAIRHRIIAQNAVDSAADSAALWQARGCNLLQHLNNLHYDGDMIMLAAELSTLGACVAGVALKAFVFTYAAGEAACAICALAPYIDRAQELFNTAILKVQKGIAEVFPVLAFGYANACAKGSGADKLGDVLSTYAGDLLSAAGIHVPALDSVFSSLGSLLGNIPVYAMVLDVDSLSLHVEEKQAGKWDMPWALPQEIVVPLAVIGNGCVSEGFDYSIPDEWGWRDSYYTGNPGFMTWAAGKVRQDELAGLGKMIWLNPGASKSFDEMKTLSETFYKGQTESATELKIPAFLAIASSQVEGEPVVSKGKPNATPKLMTVQIPPDDNPTPGTKFLIYH